LPAVNTHTHLPPVSGLLTTQENAAIHAANRSERKASYFLSREDKQTYLQLVKRYDGPGRTVGEIYQYIESVLLTAQGAAEDKLKKISKSSKRALIKWYKAKVKEGKTEEGLLLVPVWKKKCGRRAVFTPEVEEDIAKTLTAWLASSPMGLTIEFIVAHVKALAETPQKYHWRMCIREYNKRNRRPFEFNHQWVRAHLREWGYSSRKGTTAARKLPPNVGEVHDTFIQRLAYTVRDNLPEGVTMVVDGVEEEVKMIPLDLVVNTDQGGIPVIAFQDATWARTGAKAVPLMGHEDKRQMTAVLASNAAGVVLPLQIIMNGKTDGSLPSQADRSAAEGAGFHYTVTENHWANLETSKKYVVNVLQPFLNRQRERLQLPMNFPAVWIIDCWPVHISSDFLTYMSDRYPEIRLLFVPANCTGVMQPADLGGQRELKCGLKALGTMYAIVQVREALQKLQHLSEEERIKKIEGGAIKIDTTLTNLKPLLPGWHLAVWRHLQEKGALLKGWEKSRLLEALDERLGPLHFQVAEAKIVSNTLWANTQVIVEGGVAVPVGVERVRVTRVRKNDAGEDVEVEVEEDVPEPKESEQDIAEMEEERVRCATAGEKVCVFMC